MGPLSRFVHTDPYGYARAVPRPRTKKTNPKPSLDAEAWEEAALVALARGGAVALSVEAIARALGTTKGSFYWHFADRDALLKGALARWETRYTERVIEKLEKVTDPRERLTYLIRGIGTSLGAWRVHVALSASPDEPLMLTALARVSKRRIAYLDACYRGLGWPPAKARSQAVLAYATYLGFLHLRVEGPKELPSGRARDAYMTAIVEALIPPGVAVPSTGRRVGRRG
jgi:AcrR family transcriptional regulator